MNELCIVYDVAGWAYHNRALALQKYSPPDFRVSLATHQNQTLQVEDTARKNFQLILALPVRQSSRIIIDDLQKSHDSIVVQSWNNGWPMRLPLFYELHQKADFLVVNNPGFFNFTGPLPRMRYLPNGVDLSCFHAKRPIAHRKPKVLWCGSLFHRGVKGYDNLIEPLSTKLEAAGIDFDWHLVDSVSGNKRSRQEMAEWYNSGTVYVCASSSEGTPNTALEAAACGCTVVSTPVGNMPELIVHGENGLFAERTVEALFAGIVEAQSAYPSLAAQMQEDIQEWDWKLRSKPFFELFRQLLANDVDDPPPPDLSSQVTVFVTTIGGPTLDACLHCLRCQDTRFQLQVIDHVAPMSRAFQQMLDTVATPYYVQVDEDMLLYPHAVRTLYECIRNADKKTALHVEYLYDVHLERPIQGVKIFRRDIVRQYPFENVESPAKRRLKKLKSDGFLISKSELPNRQIPWTKCLGLHGAEWSTQSIFERYFNLERKRRIHPDAMNWFKEYPAVFTKRFFEDPSEMNFFALMGSVAGRLAELEDRDEKDFRAYPQLPGLKLMQEFYDNFNRQEPD